jgi:hypothetical protein
MCGRNPSGDGAVAFYEWTAHSGSSSSLHQYYRRRPNRVKQKVRDWPVFISVYEGPCLAFYIVDYRTYTKYTSCLGILFVFCAPDSRATLRFVCGPCSLMNQASVSPNRFFRFTLAAGVALACQHQGLNLVEQSRFGAVEWHTGIFGLETYFARPPLNSLLKDRANPLLDDVSPLALTVPVTPRLIGF